MGLFQRKRSLGTTLLAAWLIAHGALALVTTSIPYAGVVLGIVALAAGVLILLDR